MAVLGIVLNVSHPTMGAWIEITLKNIAYVAGEGSHPTMGAWIEIFICLMYSLGLKRRTPRWVRGLKYDWNKLKIKYNECRTPRWVRGLKYMNEAQFIGNAIVAPHDGCVD